MRPVVMIRPARGRVLLAASWAYAVSVLAALGLIRWVGDAWWGVTLLVFMPRWLFLVPGVGLALASGLRRCPGHWAVQGAAVLVVAGPLMNLSLPVRRLWPSPLGGERVRVVTFNVGLRWTRDNALRHWADRNRIDVVCLQEGTRDGSTLQSFREAGWHLSRGARVASRFPIVEEQPEWEPRWDTEQRQSSMLERVRLRTPSGREFVVATVHLPTLRPGFERFLSRADPSGIGLHAEWWGRETSRVLSALAEVGDLPLMIGGDFNMPADDSTMAALRSSYRFAFEEAGWGYGYTRPSRLPWVRIDHLLTSPEWAVTACRVGPDLGSDHLPLWCEAVLTTPPPPPR